MKIDEIFNRFWSIYISSNPHAKKVYDLFISEGETVLNDHIAFRTFNDSRINIEKLSKIFLSQGYKAMGEYRFEDKHLFAKHFEHHSDKTLPRIFISELILEEFDDKFKSTITRFIDAIPSQLINSDELLFMGNIWGLPSFELYKEMMHRSEYAAWLLVNGFTANHFTVSINSLKKFDTIQKVNQLLKENGFELNDSGGEIKGSPEELLEQSSTKAGKQSIKFPDGIFEVPACYYEFAKRYPTESGELYSGFIAKSADKIFESTDYK